MLARAHWRNTGMADSAQLVGGSFWPEPSLHTITEAPGDRSPHTGVPRYTCQAWACCLWPVCTGGWPSPDPPCARSSPILGSLGSDCFLTPTPGPWLSNYPILYLHLPLLFTQVDVSGWDPLHPLNLSCLQLPWVRVCMLCPPSPSSALGRRSRSSN